jgi:DNA adenine methylase
MNLKQLSPLRYPGGKVKVLDYIIQVIGKNNAIGSEYVEPYAGGAAVALGLLIGGHVSRIHINDLDNGIYHFWHSIINDTDRFIKKIEDTPVDVTEWLKQKAIYKNIDNHSQLESGFATFYLNRCNRSGILTAGCIGGKEQLGDYRIDARFNKVELIKRISLIASYRDRISLYNEDTLSLLKANREKFNKMILYLDPPYYVKGASLYKNFYSHEDHLNISEFLRSVDGIWIVSYDDVPDIVNIYRDFKKRKFSLSYSAGSKKRGKEIMFFSDNLIIPRCGIV